MSPDPAAAAGVPIYLSAGRSAVPTPRSVRCPKCDAALPATAGFRAGRRVQCPSCEAPIVVPDTGEPEPDPARARPRRSRRAEDEDDRPPRRRDGSRSTGRGDARGRRESGDRRLKGNVYVRVGTLAVLLTTLGVLSWLLYRKVERDREAAAFKQEMEQGAAPVLDYTAPPPKADAAPFTRLVPEGLDARAHEAHVAVARRLVGRWDSTSQESPDVRMEFGEDGLVKQFYKDADGKLSPRTPERWKVIVVAGDGGTVEFWESGRTRRLEFRLEDGGDRLVFVGTRLGDVGYQRQK